MGGGASEGVKVALRALRARSARSYFSTILSYLCNLEPKKYIPFGFSGPHPTPTNLTTALLRTCGPSSGLPTPPLCREIPPAAHPVANGRHHKARPGGAAR